MHPCAAFLNLLFEKTNSYNCFKTNQALQQGTLNFPSTALLIVNQDITDNMFCYWFYCYTVNPFPHITILQQTTLNIFCQKIDYLYNSMDNLWLKVENIVSKGEIARFECILLCIYYVSLHICVLWMNKWQL